MKKILNITLFLFAFILSLNFVNASVIYQVYEPSFSFSTPNSLYVNGANCQDNSCSSITGKIDLFNGDAFINCWNTYKSNHNGNQFLSCVDNARLSGNIINLNQMSKIVTKETITSLGSIKQFFASDDSYLPMYSRSQNFVCNYDICIEEAPKRLNFVKKDNAIAEIGQLNIKNLDNPLLPIQVQVPVSIEETVCSAFRYTNPETYKFQPPAGYSDYSANTQITLNIENANTGLKYVTDQKVTIPIEADTCAGLGAFTWTAPSYLQNEDIKFTVDTLVIDNQVETSIKDSASVIETIYPNDLANSCWTRSQDFTLSNIPDDFTMTPSVAQITQGEYLYANFRVGAWRGISETPIDYSIEVLIDGVTIYSSTTTSGNVISDFSIDLSSKITNFNPGTKHNVTLITTPIGNDCLVSESVIQQQDLIILPIDYNTLTVHVSDENGILLNNAKINVSLINVDDYFVNPPTYKNTLNTNNQGISTFTNLVSGNYNVIVLKEGYETANQNFHIASNMDLYFALYEINSPPVIDLLSNYTLFYQDSLYIDLTEYINDYNDPFSDLTIQASTIQGVATTQIIGNILKVSTNQIGVATIKVTVTDSKGESATDTTNINFIGNQAPVIISFSTPFDNGDAPFSTYFVGHITDAENDILTCNIDFDDNTPVHQSDCSDLNYIAHTFNNPGTYNVVLSVKDQYNDLVQATVQIFVYEVQYSSPKIDTFILNSSNGTYIPTNLKFTWSASHPDNLPITCSLRINGVANDVSCVGEYNLLNFNTMGTSTFTIIVTDSLGVQEERTITENFIKYNNPPVITTFNANPNSGIAPLNTVFNIIVNDVDSNNLNCRLNFGDGSSEIVDLCSNLNGITKTYSSFGTYTSILNVYDEINTVQATEVIIVEQNELNGPIINDFEVLTSNDNLLPNNLTFIYSAQDPTGLTMSCFIDVNGITLNLPTCNGVTTYNNYNISGSSTFTFSVTNSASTTNLSRTIIFAFPNTVDLSLDMVELNIANQIAPGKFDFNVVILNETLASRELYFIPKIVCNGISNKLNNNNNGILSTSVISKVEREKGFIYYMSSNTQDYKFVVPENTLCRFELNVKDLYGTDFTISSPVTFKLPTEIKKIQSIRGSTTDITNYMSSVLSGNINKGYNSIEFNVENNDLTQKDLVITMTSRELNINYNLEITLASGQQKTVLIPLYINENSKKGNYPLRFSVYDGNKKQVRYSYINLN